MTNTARLSIIAILCSLTTVDYATLQASSAEPASAVVVAATTRSVFPNQLLADVLRDLKLEPSKISVLSVLVDEFPDDSVFAGLASVDNPIAIPLLARNHLVVQLSPNLGSDAILELFLEYKLTPIEVMPELGIVVVRTPDFSGDPTEIDDLADMQELPIMRLIASLAPHNSVLSISLDTFLSPLAARSGVTSKLGAAEVGLDTEHPDWGIRDAKFDLIWPRLSPRMRVGIVDVGFRKHFDLTLKKGLSVADRLHNHGTQAAGIMCAKHNGRGAMGALKDCTVVYSPTRSLLRKFHRIEGQDIVAYSVRFSEYIATVHSFILSNPDIKVINLSMGYNWMKNFNEDPSSCTRIRNAVSCAQIRDVVKTNGEQARSVLELAEYFDIAIVSAAGNDSEFSSTPLDAKWASPFNFASKFMYDQNQWSNGLVVQGHDKNGQRVDSSNVGGDISCPGEKIWSTSATPEDSFLIDSGTSMASPYCAAGLAALMNIRRGISLQNAMRCITKSPDTSGGVPRLNIEYAIANCTT